MALLPVTLSRREDMIADGGRFSHLVESLSKGTIAARSRFGENQVSLDPEEIAGLSLWTKAPRRFVDLFRSAEGRRLLNRYRIEEDRYRIELQVSITGAGSSALEPGVPPPDEVLSGLDELVAAGFVGRTITWRFDPMVVTEQFPVSFWIDSFTQTAARMQAMGVEKVIFSFMDSYSHTHNPDVLARFAAAGLSHPDEFPPMDKREGAIDTDERYRTSEHRKIVSHLVDLSGRSGFRLHCCRDGYDAKSGLEGFPELKGIARGGCTSQAWYEDIWAPIKVSRSRFSGATHFCECTASRDGGRYDVHCGRCIYCYADGETDAAGWARRGRGLWPAGPECPPVETPRPRD